MSMNLCHLKKSILTQNLSKSGNPDNTISCQEHEKGLATPPFENSQSDQKVGYSSAPAAQFYKATAGNEKGK